MSKTKKSVAIIVAAATCVAVFAYSGCCNHGHESNSYQATCTQAGYYEDICFKCGNVNERYETTPALGHAYEGGFCSRCGEPDPNDASLSDGAAGKLNLTESGTLSWTKLKKATKYELALTLPGETEPKTYVIPKTQSSIKLDEFFGKDNYNNDILFPAGRTFAKFVHYELYEETVEGEKIEQEFPVEEQADEFRILKRNGKYELVRMGYSDENVTLSGFYSQPKRDDNGEYFLCEVVMEDNGKPQKFNISKQVKPASGNKAAYYRSADDRQNGRNAISSFDMPYQTIPAGASTYYMRLTLASGGYKDYDLRVYGLRSLEVRRYIASGVDDGATRTKLDSLNCVEGDIIPVEALCVGLRAYGSYVVAESGFKTVGKVQGEYIGGEHKYVGDADYTAWASGYGDNTDLYFYNDSYESKIKELAQSYEEWSEAYAISEVWEQEGSVERLNGCTLSYRNASGASEAVIPSKLCNMTVRAADFTFAQVSTLTVKSYKLPKLSLANSAVTTINLDGVYEVPALAFVGANANLVINCAFGKDTADGYYAAKWNYNGDSIYAKPYTTNYGVAF